MRFQGKKAVVLGVLNKRSMAACAARLLIAEGADVMCSHLPDAAGAPRRRAMALSAVPGMADDHLVPLDVSDDASIDACLQRVQQVLGRIDLLIHAICLVDAPATRYPVTDITRHQFVSSMEVSAYSLIAVLRQARGLLQPGSSVVAYSYLSSQRHVAGYEALGVCKAALESIVLQSAAELGRDGIRINAVSAPPTATTSALANPGFAGLVQTYERHSLLGRVPSAEQVSRVVAFLLSDEAAGITGDVVTVDGGFHQIAPA